MVPHYASDYSLIMGIVDLLPVALFALAGCILIKNLFNVLKKPFAVLLCSGVTLCLTAGTFKAIWKILLSLNICDFYPFDVMFLPTQSLGFVLMGVGLLSILFDKDLRSSKKTYVFVLPLLVLAAAAEPAKQFDGSMIFIGMLVVGTIMIDTPLCYLSFKNKKWYCAVLFIINFIGLMIMGAMKPLSTKMSMSVTAANWIEESVNIVAQAAMLAGCYLLNKGGFFAFKENPSD